MVKGKNRQNKVKEDLRSLRRPFFRVGIFLQKIREIYQLLYEVDTESTTPYLYLDLCIIMHRPSFLIDARNACNFNGYRSLAVCIGIIARLFETDRKTEWRYGSSKRDSKRLKKYYDREKLVSFWRFFRKYTNPEEIDEAQRSFGSTVPCINM